MYLHLGGGERKRQSLLGWGLVWKPHRPFDAALHLGTLPYTLASITQSLQHCLKDACRHAVVCLRTARVQLSNLLKRVGFCNTPTKLILVGLQHLTCVTADLFSPNK